MPGSTDELKIAKRIFDEEFWRYPRYKIHYYIPHFREETETPSFFMAYWPGILYSINLIEASLRLPFDIRELKSGRESVAIARTAEMTSPTIAPITIEALEENTQIFNYVFYKCILSDDRTYQRVNDLVTKSGSGWLHLSTSSDADAAIKNFSMHRFERYIIERTDELLKNKKIDTSFVNTLRELLAPKRPPWKRITFPGFSHGITRPNEIAASSLGGEIHTVKELNVSCLDDYIPAVVKSCKALITFRKKLADKVPIENNLCLTAEPVLWGTYKADVDRDLFGNLNESDEIKRGLRRIVKSIRAPSGYSKLNFASNKESLDRLFKSQAVMSFLQAYSLETRAYTTSLAILNTPSLTPTLRVESRVNQIKGDLINLAKCARGSNPHINFKTCKLTLRIQEKIESSIAKEYLGLIDKTLPEYSGVSLVSDIPLEWIPLRGLPLTLRCDLSRISATPGNLTLLQCMRSQHINIAAKQFEEILIIRSFEDNDKIKFVLERILDQISVQHEKYPSYKFVDVKTADQFVEAVNSFTGALMIFDGHGTLSRENAIGSIIVGGKPLDVWTLKESVRMPPIVLLSACDTIPLDGSHGSSANGLLTLGAVTVLGTVLPVDSARSAIFIARLLHRLAEFLPIVISRASYMPWRSFMSGLLRMTFCSEMIIALVNDAKIITMNHYPRIQMKANVAINSLDPDWYEIVVSEICLCSGLEKDIVLEKCRFWGAMVDSLKYIQLGRPEKIRLRSISLEEAMQVMLKSKNMKLDSLPMMDAIPSIFAH